jgi:tetratricopeptide (TPR) repeat protein
MAVAVAHAAAGGTILPIGTTVSRPRFDLPCRATALALVAGLCGAAGARAQATPPCSTPECTNRDRLWVPAAQIHEIKNQFVAAVRQFTEASAGAYGDEGSRLSSSLDAMGRTLSGWDAAIRSYETMVKTLDGSAEVHVALATVYIDRHRPGDALTELAAAGRLDGRRPDVHTLAAMAYGLDGKPAEAADELRAALKVNRGDPITLYGLAQQLNKANRRDDAVDALRRFNESEWPRLRHQRGGRPSAPFERAGLLRQAAGVTPIFPIHTYRTGFGLLLDGKYDAALVELRRAAVSDPLTSVSGVAEHASALRRGQLGQAVRGLERYVAGDGAGPARAEGLRVLGRAYWVDGQFERSAALLADAVRLAPQDERARLVLADVLVDAGKSTDAEQALASAIEAIPDSGQAHDRLGQLYQSRSLFPQAIREYEAAAALTPLVGLDRLFDTIGGAYSNQADFDHVVSAYLQRIDANPNNADAHKSLGEIYFLQGRADEALAEFAAAALIDPGNVGALVGAGQTFLRLGRFEEALDLSTQALELDQRLKDARYTLAMSLMRLGKTGEGRRELAVFERMQADVMASTQRQSELNTARRDASRRLADGDYPAAAALLRQAAVLDENDASLYRELGVALAKAGRHDEAVPALEKAIQLEDTADAHRLLAESYKALGRLTDSQAETSLAVRVTERAKADRLQRLNGAR